MKILVNKFQGLGDMITIGDHDLRIILHHRYHYGFCIQQRIDIPSVDDHLNVQETEQCLVFAGNNDMIRRFDIVLGLIPTKLASLFFSAGDCLFQRFDDLDKFCGHQRSTSNQPAIYIGTTEKLFGVVGFYTSAVQDRDFVGHFRSILGSQYRT
jgi:hypothetical protein